MDPPERCPACGRRRARPKPPPRAALVGRGYIGYAHFGPPAPAPAAGVELFFEGLVTTNELNDRKTKQRGKGGLGVVQRAVVDAGMRDWLASRGWRRPADRMLVTLTRVAPSEGLDTDGLAAALKRVRDAVAAAFGVDDGPDGPITWVPEQRRGPWGVEVRVEWGQGLWAR